jgi:putative oxidoreductase
MFKKLFSPAPISQNGIIGFLRIIIGIFMIYHGWEVFDKEPIARYSGWLIDRNFPAPEFFAYLGKATELAGGILLTLGLFTRIATIPLMSVMLFIIFVLSEGKIFYEDQHPFLFFLFFVLFFFTGPGKWSLDSRIFK